MANTENIIFKITVDATNAIKSLTGVDSEVKKLTDESKKLDDTSKKVSKTTDDLSNVEKKATKTKDDLKKSTKDLKDATKETALSTEDLFKNLSKVNLLQTGAVIAGITGTFVLLFKAINDVTDKAREFENGMRNVNSIALQTEEDYQKTVLAVKTFGAEMNLNLVDMSKGLYQLNSAGFSVAGGGLNILNVATKTASAGLSSLDDSVKVIAATMNSYKESNITAEHAGDLLIKTVQLGVTTFPELANSIGMALPTAAAAGMTMEELTASIITLTRAGMSVPTSVTSINGVLTTLLSPAKEAAVLAKELGINFSTSALRSKGFLAVLQDIMIKTKGNDAVLASLFGNVRGLRGIFSLLSGDGETYTKFLYEQNHAVGALNSSYAEQKKTFDRVSKSITNNLDALKINLGEVILDGFKPFLESIRDTLKYFNSLDDATKKEIITVGLFTTAIINLSIAVKGLMMLGLAKWLIGAKEAMIGFKLASGVIAGDIALTGAAAVGTVVAAGAVAVGGAALVTKGYLDMKIAQKEAKDSEEENLKVMTNAYDKLKELETKKSNGRKLSAKELKELALAYRIASTDELQTAKRKKEYIERSDEAIAAYKKEAKGIKDLKESYKVLTDEDLQKLLDAGKLTSKILLNMMVNGQIDDLQRTSFLNLIKERKAALDKEAKETAKKRKKDLEDAQNDAKKTAEDIRTNNIQLAKDSLNKEVALVKDKYSKLINEQKELIKKGAGTQAKSNIVELTKQQNIEIAKVTEEYAKKKKDDDEKTAKENLAKLKEQADKELQTAELKANLIDDEIKKENALYDAKVKNTNKIYKGDSDRLLRLQNLQKEHNATIEKLNKDLADKQIAKAKEYHDALKNLKDIEIKNEEDLYSNLMTQSDDNIKNAEYNFSLKKLAEKSYTETIKNELNIQLGFIDDALENEKISETKKIEYRKERIKITQELEKNAFELEKKTQKEKADYAKQGKDIEQELYDEQINKQKDLQDNIIASLNIISDAFKTSNNESLQVFGDKIKATINDVQLVGKALAGDISSIVTLTVELFSTVSKTVDEYDKELKATGDSNMAFLSAQQEFMQELPIIGLFTQMATGLTEFITGHKDLKGAREEFEKYNDGLKELSKSFRDVQMDNLNLMATLTENLTDKLNLIKQTYFNNVADIISKQTQLLKDLANATTQDQKDLITNNINTLSTYLTNLTEKYSKDTANLSEESTKKIANDQLSLAELKAQLIDDSIEQENFLYQATVENYKKVYTSGENLNIRLLVLEKDHNQKLKDLRKKAVQDSLTLAEEKYRAEKGFSELAQKELELTLTNNQDILDNLNEALKLFEKQREKARESLPTEAITKFQGLLTSLKSTLDPNFFYQSLSEFERKELEAKQRIENELVEGKITKEQSLVKYQELSVKRYLYMQKIEASLTKNTKERTEYEGKKYDAEKEYQDLALEIYDADTQAQKKSKESTIENQQDIVDNLAKNLETKQKDMTKYLKELEVSLLKTGVSFATVINDALSNINSNASKLNIKNNESTTTTPKTPASATGIIVNPTDFYEGGKVSTTPTKVKNNIYADESTSVNKNTFGIGNSQASLVYTREEIAQRIIDSIMSNPRNYNESTKQDTVDRLNTTYMGYAKNKDDASLIHYAKFFLGLDIPRFNTGGYSKGGLVMTEPNELLLNDSQQRKLYGIINNSASNYSNSNSLAVNINIGNMSGSQQDINKLSTAVGNTITSRLLKFNLR